MLCLPVHAHSEHVTCSSLVGRRVGAAAGTAGLHSDEDDGRQRLQKAGVHGTVPAA